MYPSISWIISRQHIIIGYSEIWSKFWWTWNWSWEWLSIDYEADDGIWSRCSSFFLGLPLRSPVQRLKIGGDALSACSSHYIHGNYRSSRSRSRSRALFKLCCGGSLRFEVQELMAARPRHVHPHGPNLADMWCTWSDFAICRSFWSPFVSVEVQTKHWAEIGLFIIWAVWMVYFVQ